MNPKYIEVNGQVWIRTDLPGVGERYQRLVRGRINATTQANLLSLDELKKVFELDYKPVT